MIMVCIDFREYRTKSWYSESRQSCSFSIYLERNFIVLPSIHPLSQSVSPSASIVIPHQSHYYNNSLFLLLWLHIFIIHSVSWFAVFHSSAIIRQMKWMENIKIGKILPFFTSRTIFFVYSFKKNRILIFRGNPSERKEN